MTGFNFVRVIANSIFSSNYAPIDGGDLYASLSNNSLNVENIKVTNLESFNSFYLDQVNFFGKNIQMTSINLIFNFFRVN